MTPQRGILALTGSDAPFRWNAFGDLGTPAVVTYSFGAGPAPYELREDGTHANSGYRAWSETQREHARAALLEWEDVSGLRFIEVPDIQMGDLRFSIVDLTGQFRSDGRQISGYADYPPQADAFLTDDYTDGYAHAWYSGDMFFNQTRMRDTTIHASDEKPSYHTLLLHEIGHAIGLKHPFEGSPQLREERDDGRFTVMSYTYTTSVDSIGPLDIAAARFLYGPSSKTLTAFWAEGAEQLVQKGGRWKDDLSGSHLDDRLVGRAGGDTLRGYAGDDVAAGGKGRDRIDLGSGDDIARGGGGADFIVLGSGDDRANGGKGDDELQGGAGNDTLIGGAGRDTISGGPGSDLLAGGTGADLFLFDPNRELYEYGDPDDLSLSDFTVSLDRIVDFNPAEDRIEIDLGGEGPESLEFVQEAAAVLVLYYGEAFIRIEAATVVEIESAGLLFV